MNRKGENMWLWQREYFIDVQTLEEAGEGLLFAQEEEI